MCAQQIYLSNPTRIKKQMIPRRNYDRCRLALLATTPAEAESLLNNLDRAVRGIVLFVISDKTEFMCFNQDDAISLLNGKPQKLVDQFIYLGSNIPSTESDVKIRINKAWTAISINFLFLR